LPVLLTTFSRNTKASQWRHQDPRETVHMLSSKLEDFLGKAFLVGISGWLLMYNCIGLVLQVKAPDRPDDFALILMARVVSLFFVAMVIALTLRRLPARSCARGWQPRAAAILGAVMLMLLIWLTPGTPPTGALIAANVLIVVGTLGSIYCLHFLGRSFAVLAAARELVTDGPYRHVRHPLYFAEGLTCMGIVISHWSWPAVLVGLAQLVVQFWRMQHEEAVLRAAFPEYEAYAQRVPMIVSLVRPAELGDLKDAEPVPTPAAI
jgi:protein-S-isoprenylcysteine O-methyltransferase Ste14